MNQEERDKLLELKNRLTEFREEKKDFKIQVNELRRVQAKKLKTMNNELGLKRAELLADKELRAEHGFTNDKLWQKKIDNDLTKNDAEMIEVEEGQMQKHIDTLEEQISGLSIKIESIQWELRIYLEYHHTEA
jgi:vacuolar-type H+-ATPase subunit I/STV1